MPVDFLYVTTTEDFERLQYYNFKTSCLKKTKTFF